MADRLISFAYAKKRETGYFLFLILLREEGRMPR
jgi:hypothetical protein